MKRVIMILLTVMLAAAFGCAPKADPTPTAAPEPTQTQAATEKPEQTAATTEPVKATMVIKDFGTIELELYPDIAPQSVYNFCDLARKGFYDGLTFHRVISGFMIQGGDPLGTGTGGPGYSIKGEFALNGVENGLLHTRGVISMARAQSYDSAGSQFFIMHQDVAQLDGQYAAFGKVTSGIEVVDAIAAVETGAGDKPLEDVVIESVTIDGPELPEPDKLAE